MDNSFAVTPKVGITEIHFVTVPNTQGGGQLSRGEWQLHVLDISRACFRPKVDESCTHGNRPQTASQDTLENCYIHCTKCETQSMLGTSSATQLRLNKGTKLDCHHHACTYGSDVARSDGEKQVGSAPSSAQPPAQLGGVLRDGQWLPTVQLHGLISLVLSRVLGFVHGPRLSRFVLTSRVLERTH